MHFRNPVALIGALALVLVATIAAVNGGADPRLAHPAPGEWPSDGRDYTAQRYSPLTQIDASNVGRLGLAWYADLRRRRALQLAAVQRDQGL
jgi:quinohemoprotein ethanol dehydrogenase